MTKRFIWLILLVASLGYAQEQEVKKTIDLFFKGLHTGDTTLIKQVMHPEIKMQTTFFNNEGLPELRTSPAERFLKSVGSKKPEDKWFEKLLEYQIHVDANLASAWTPYEFYVNDKFSHCGVNSFQLVKLKGNWVITYLIDTRRREGCK